MPPQPFQISISQDRIDALKTKLSFAQFPDELPDANWDLGVPLQEVKRLTKAWEEWDWRGAEERLNRTPQFTTGVEVDGYGELDVHFVWQRSEVKEAIPLLFVHGCVYFPSLCFLEEEDESEIEIEERISILTLWIHRARIFHGGSSSSSASPTTRRSSIPYCSPFTSKLWI
jgi:hypothetical protein